MNVVNVNDRFLEFEHIQRQDVLNRSIINSSFPMSFNPSIIPYIKDALKGAESNIEAALQKNGDILPLTCASSPRCSTIRLKASPCSSRISRRARRRKPP